MGLYQGDKLAVPARQIYFDRFRGMLLNPTQANFAGYLRGLPVSPAPGADYTAAYNPLKAYLITTSNPEKSQAQFLTPVFLQYWMGSNIKDPAQQQLARQQIDFYAGELVRQNPYNITPDNAAVAKARTYLSNFGAVPRIYQDMLALADKASPGVDFNRQYPNAASSIIESHLVRGAFTRAGFAFMQAAMQHPERYFQGETWVLGDQAARSLDSAGVSKQLAAMYSAEFLKEWHAFLNDAHFTACGPIKELPNKLNALAGPDSPLLEFFGTASYNTAVPDPQIKAIFQPTQALVDPNSTARFIGPGNTAYVNALLSLSSAVGQFNQNPETSGDMLGSAVSTAGIAVQQTAQPFNVDPQMHTEKTVFALLEAPIRCAVPPPPPPPPGAPGSLCSLLGKFPFQPLSKAQANRDLTPADQATVGEVNSASLRAREVCGRITTPASSRGCFNRGRITCLRPTRQGMWAPPLRSSSIMRQQSPRPSILPGEPTLRLTSCFAPCLAKALKMPPWWWTVRESRQGRRRNNSPGMAPLLIRLRWLTTQRKPCSSRVLGRFFSW